MAFAWQSKGYLVNDADALFKLSIADNKKQFKQNYHKALFDFVTVKQDGQSFLVNHAFAAQYADKMGAGIRSEKPDVREQTRRPPKPRRKNAKKFQPRRKLR
jgi:hypothetical protein